MTILANCHHHISPIHAANRLPQDISVSSLCPKAQKPRIKVIIVSRTPKPCSISIILTIYIRDRISFNIQLQAHPWVDIWGSFIRHLYFVKQLSVVHISALRSDCNYTIIIYDMDYVLVLCFRFRCNHIYMRINMWISAFTIVTYMGIYIYGNPSLGCIAKTKLCFVNQGTGFFLQIEIRKY